MKTPENQALTTEREEIKTRQHMDLEKVQIHLHLARRESSHSPADDHQVSSAFDSDNGVLHKMVLKNDANHTNAISRETFN